MLVSVLFGDVFTLVGLEETLLVSDVDEDVDEGDVVD